MFLNPFSTQSIRGCLKLMTDQSSARKAGVMIPIPQYPLYSASLAEYNMEQVAHCSPSCSSSCH